MPKLPSLNNSAPERLTPAVTPGQAAAEGGRHAARFDAVAKPLLNFTHKVLEEEAQTTASTRG